MRSLQIGKRIFLQLKGDPRFLAISIVAPCLIIFLMQVLFDVMENPFIKLERFIVPMAGFIVFFVTFILSAIAVIRERSQGTLSRMFVNGFRRYEIIAGYLTGYIALATVQTICIFFETVWLFDLTMTGTEKLQYIVTIWMLGITSISLGILISTLAQNEGQVFPFIPLIILPTVFFSGLIVKVDVLPGWAQWASKIIPFTYANDGILGIMDGKMDQFWQGFGSLMLVGVIMLIISSLTLREYE